MLQAYALHVTVFAGRWLWLAVALAVLGVGAYLFARLSAFDDQADLAAKVAELRTFQVQLVSASLGEQAGMAPDGLADRVFADTEAHADVLRGSLAHLDDGGASLRAIDAYLANLQEIEDIGDALIGGETSLDEVAFTYAQISAEANSQIDLVLQVLATEGQRTADDLRDVAFLGLALIVGGGLASAVGYGWTGRRAQSLERDIEYQREIDRMKNEFVALASHELRTPLTGIYGFSQLLALDDGSTPDEERRQWAGHIHSEAARLTEIVEDLLNVARIESGGMRIEREPVPFADVVEAVLRSFSGRSDRHAIEAAGDLDATVVGDRGKLVQVLSNIVDNAIKYSPNGGTVRIEGRAGSELLRVSVSDQGVGIPAEALDKVFGRFERIAHPETEHVRSTGLGLYLVRELVTQMGGTIRAESTRGEGSMFTFTVPLERAAAGVAVEAAA